MSERATVEHISDAVAFIRKRTPLVPQAGIILGSGLGDVVDSIEADAVIPYAEIPHAARSSVVGHSGRLVVGRAGELPVAIMQGRVHCYEGHEIEDVVFLARVLARLGVRSAVVTNAAGGVNEAFRPGDLMLISDHVNMLGVNPLRGPNFDELGVRFPDMSEAYSPALRKLAREAAGEAGVTLKEGVYIALPGPSYETPAEIRALRTLGADAVGMSTVPEVIALVHMGVPVLGISCITNMAAGILPRKLDHAEVLETTGRVRFEFTSLMLAILRKLGEAGRNAEG
jgi:purine-nucleoside phosphorylase